MRDPFASSDLHNMSSFFMMRTVSDDADPQQSVSTLPNHLFQAQHERNRLASTEEQIPKYTS
jgi:hypothetical protein